MQDLVDNFVDEPRAQRILTQGSRANKLVGRIKFSSKTTVEDLREANKALSKSLEELQTEINYIKAVLATT